MQREHGIKRSEDGESVVITGRMDCGSDDNSLNLFGVRALCAAWWGGQNDPLYAVSSSLYARDKWERLAVDEEDGVSFVLTLTREQWEAVVGAALACDGAGGVTAGHYEDHEDVDDAVMCILRYARDLADSDLKVGVQHG